MMAAIEKSEVARGLASSGELGMLAGDMSASVSVSVYESHRAAARRTETLRCRLSRDWRPYRSPPPDAPSPGHQPLLGGVNATSRRPSPWQRGGVSAADSQSPSAAAGGGGASAAAGRRRRSVLRGGPAAAAPIRLIAIEYTEDFSADD